MRDTCDEIHRKQYNNLRTLFIPLCLKSHDRNYLNILRMITILNHLYVEHEIYAVAYNKKRNRPNDHLFLQNTISKWDDDNSLGIILGKIITL